MKAPKRGFLRGLLIFALTILVLQSSAFAQEKNQEKIDIKKVLVEIAGEYEVNIQGQIVEITFFVSKSGVTLWGGPTGREEELTMVTDDGLEFRGPDEPQILKFIRDDDGKINRFTVDHPTMGEIEGVRIKKK